MDRLFIGFLLLRATGFLMCYSMQEDEDVHVELITNKKVCEGSSVTMNCSFKPPKNYKVSWFYDKTLQKNCNSLTNKIDGDKYFRNEHNRSGSLHQIPSIRTNESGWYYCMVTQNIPILKKTCNGIQVMVEANSTLSQTPNPSTDYPATTCSVPVPAATVSPPSVSPFLNQWWIWLGLAIGCIILVVSIVIVSILTRKTEEIVYENTRPKEASNCWRYRQNPMGICHTATSKKIDNIKPLRKYDAYTDQVGHRL